MNRCRICGSPAAARVDDLVIFDICQACADDPEREIKSEAREPGSPPLPTIPQDGPATAHNRGGTGLPGYAIYRQDRIMGEVEPDWPTAADWYGYE